MNFIRRLKYMKVDLSEIDRLTYNGRNWISVFNDQQGHNFECEDNPKILMSLDWEKLYNALSSGDAKVTYGYHHPVQSMMRRLYGNKRLTDFKDDFVQLARHKALIISYYEEHCRENGRPTRDHLGDYLQQWNANANDERRRIAKKGKNSSKATAFKVFDEPNPRTFLDYYDKYLAAGRDIRILVPRHRGPGPHHRLKNVDADSRGWWNRFAHGYLDTRRPTMKACRLGCLAAIHEENKHREEWNEQHAHDDDFVARTMLIAPTRKQFERIINGFDEARIVAAREGRKKALALFREQETGFDIRRPGERVEFDGWMLEAQTFLNEIDLWDRIDNPTKDRFRTSRLYLSMARDAATGYILSIRAGFSENSALIIDTLDMAIADKKHIATFVGAKTPWYGGVRIQSAYTDNGTAFTSDLVHDAFREAGVSLSHPPAGQPWHRPFIESVFATIGRSLLGMFHGRTFANVTEKGDYKSEKEATLTIDEFLSLIIRAVLDYYHHLPHWRTGQSPHDAWCDYLEQFPHQYGTDVGARISVFGRQRVRSNEVEGILVWGIRYWSEKLNVLRQMSGYAKATIRFHPDDMRWISVLGPDGWFLVENRINLKEQVTLAEWRLVVDEIKDAAANSQNLDVIYGALNDIRKSVDAARLRAGLSPSTATDEELDLAEQDMMRTVGLDLYEERKDREVAALPLPSNPLHNGGVDLNRPVDIARLRSTDLKQPEASDEMEKYRGQRSI